MSEPYLSQIVILSFNWPPVSYSRCDGAILQVQQNAALYSLIGDTFGGSGQVTFALPDLRGRVPIHESDSIPRGIMFGAETVALTQSELPVHTHAFYASAQGGNQPFANQNVLAEGKHYSGDDCLLYASAPTSTSSVVTMADATCDYVGGGQSHNNMQPSFVTNFCIAVAGTYPQRN